MSKVRMNNLKQLNGRILWSMINAGATPDELCARFNCTENQLNQKIFDIYGRRRESTREVWKAFEKNTAAKAAREKATKAAAIMEPPKKTDEVSKAEWLEQEFERLNKELDEITQEISSQEAKWLDCKTRIREARQKMEEAWSDYSSKRQKHEDLLGIADQMKSEWDTLTLKRAKLGSKLAKVQDELDELMRISIGIDVEADEIMILDGGEVAFSEEGKDEIFAQLVRRSDCREFQVHELLTIARAMAILYNLGSTPFEVIFADCRWQQIFEVIFASIELPKEVYVV